jgi:hypothetical protein
MRFLASRNGVSAHLSLHICKDKGKHLVRSLSKALYTLHSHHMPWQCWQDENALSGPRGSHRWSSYCPDRHPIDLEVSPRVADYSSLSGRKLMGRLASIDEKEAQVFPSTSNLLRERERRRIN